jgi:hypothetical protein
MRKNSVENSEGKRHLENQSIDGMIILDRKENGGSGVVSSASGGPR